MFRDTPRKPRLVFFQFKYDDRLPAFLLTHKREHVKCLSCFFDVTVINHDCNYREICDKYEPDLALFESGVNHSTCKRLNISNVRSNAGVPKLGLQHGDGFCNARAGFLSDMEAWGIDTFFSIAMTAAEHMPDIADRLFNWPVFIDPDVFHDYGVWKSIPVLFTGNRNQFYPWRQQLLRALSERYPSMICPHPGYEAQSSKAHVFVGEQYARLLNASWFVPACGTVARDLVRKHLEVPGSGACLIAEKTPALEAAGFVDMQNCVFADARTAPDKLDWLFRNPASLDAIIAAGFNLAHSRHTMRHRDEIYQWYLLHKRLTPGEKIVQNALFAPLTISRSADQKFAHVVSGAIHLSLLRKGDAHLRQRRYDDAARNYLECLGYMRWLPEAKLKLAVCNLYRGNARAALALASEPIQFVLRTYGAVDPDPVEWAWFIITFLCLGRLRVAARYADRYPSLHHPELERARWATAVLDGRSAAPPPTADTASRRDSIHQVRELSTDEWVAELRIMLSACGQQQMADILASAGRNGSPPCQPGNRLQAGRAQVSSGEMAAGVGRLLSRCKLRLEEDRRRLRRNISQLLHGLEARYGYFLPYTLSLARNDEFYSALRRLACEEEIRTALMIGAKPGQHATEAFLAGALANPCKPSIFCIRDASGGYWPGRHFRRGHDRVDWSRADWRTKTTTAAQQPFSRALRETDVDQFDLVFVDAAAVRNDALAAGALPRFSGARVVILRNLATTATYDLSRKLCQDEDYVLECHVPGSQGGYAIFRRSQQASKGAARVPGHVAATDTVGLSASTTNPLIVRD